MNNTIKEELKKKHPYHIWQGNDKRWRTYISDTTKKSGRKMIAKSSEESIYQFLYDYYDETLVAKLLDKITLEMLYPEWLEYKKLHTTASTYITRINSDWKSFYLGTDITKIPIKKLDKLTLDVWAHTMIKSYDMNRKKYTNMQTIMRQALSYAIDLHIISANPMDSVKIDKKVFRKDKKKPDATQVFSDSEKSQIIKLAWKDFEEKVKVYELSPLALIFQFQTGLRIGELCSVRYEDIECEDYIHIQRMVRRDTKEVVPHSKTDEGDRQVFLTTEAKRIIAVAKARQEELKVRSDGYIFSIDNKPITERCIISLLKKYCKNLGILYRSSHKVRKTYGSDLLDAGVSINTTRMMLGHSDEKTTLKYYCFDTRTDDVKKNLIEHALKCS
jgi:integrase